MQNMHKKTINDVPIQRHADVFAIDSSSSFGCLKAVKHKTRAHSQALRLKVSGS
jgi:hypothetical protein